MKKLKKLSLKKEIEREAEALEKEVSGRKDLDHITVSEDMEEALFQKIQDYEYVSMYISIKDHKHYYDVCFERQQ